MESTLPRNPIARLAESVPLDAARRTSIAARLAGAGLAFTYAATEGYDPSQVVTVTLGVIVLLLFVPLPGALGALAAGIAAGVVFMGGVVLAHEAIGVLMLVAGIVAALATGAWSHLRGDGPTAPVVGFFAGTGVVLVVILATIFTVEG